MSRARILTGGPLPFPSGGPVPDPLPNGYYALTAVSDETLAEWWWRVAQWELSATLFITAPGLPDAGAAESYSFSLPIVVRSEPRVATNELLLVYPIAIAMSGYSQGYFPHASDTRVYASSSHSVAFLGRTFLPDDSQTPGTGVFDGNRIAVAFYADLLFEVDRISDGRTLAYGQWLSLPTNSTTTPVAAASATITVGSAATGQATAALGGMIYPERVGCTGRIGDVTIRPVSWLPWADADGVPVWDVATGLPLLDPLTAPVP